MFLSLPEHQPFQSAEGCSQSWPSTVRLCPGSDTSRGTLGRSLTRLSAPCLQRVCTDSRLHVHGAGILSHSFVLKDSRIRSPNMPEKHSLHRSSNQVMKSITNNQAACPEATSSWEVRSLPPLPLNLTSLPAPQGNARWSADAVFAWRWTITPFRVRSWPRRGPA